MTASASLTAPAMYLPGLLRRVNVVERLLAGGILLACGTMFPRMLLVATVIHTPLFARVVLPALFMAVVAYAPAIWMLRKPHREVETEDLLPGNPLELTSALVFGALLALVMLLGQALTEWFGDAGVYALAAASGVADVDAITLSLARMSGGDVLLATAAIGIVLAASVNSLVKAGMAGAIGTRGLGWRVGAPMMAALILGLGAAMLQPAFN